MNNNHSFITCFILRYVGENLGIDIVNRYHEETTPPPKKKKNKYIQNVTIKCCMLQKLK